MVDRLKEELENILRTEATLNQLGDIRIDKSSEHLLNMGIAYLAGFLVKRKDLFKKLTQELPTQAFGDEKGQLRYEAWWKSDKRHRLRGPAVMAYFSNGQRKHEEWFQDGWLHRDDDGPARREWYANGQLKREEWLFRGHRMKLISYNEDGSLVAETQQIVETQKTQLPEASRNVKKTWYRSEHQDPDRSGLMVFAHRIQKDSFVDQHGFTWNRCENSEYWKSDWMLIKESRIAWDLSEFTDNESNKCRAKNPCSGCAQNTSSAG